MGGGRGGRFAGRVKLQSQHLHISSWHTTHPARKSWSGKGSSNNLLATDPFGSAQKVKSRSKGSRWEGSWGAGTPRRSAPGTWPGWGQGQEASAGGREVPARWALGDHRPSLMGGWGRGPASPGRGGRGWRCPAARAPPPGRGCPGRQLASGARGAGTR